VEGRGWDEREKGGKWKGGGKGDLLQGLRGYRRP